MGGLGQGMLSSNLSGLTGRMGSGSTDDGGDSPLNAIVTDSLVAIVTDSLVPITTDS